jgi:Lysyl oxidase
MRLVLALTAALVCALAFAPSPLAKPRPTALLPDIDQAPVGCPGGWKGDPMSCTAWDVCMVADAASPNPGCVTSGNVQAVRLRFTTTEDNVGDGPLIIYGHRNSSKQKHMTVRQAFAGSDGSVPQSYAAAQRVVPNPKVNYLYYEPAPSHKHWHLQGFEHFQLRSLAGAPIVSDRKNGVCLGDRYRIARQVPHAAKDANTPLGRLFHDFAFNTGNKPSDYNCQHGRTAASGVRDVREGISVGLGDDYSYVLDYQWLDISHIPSGRYLVVNQANAHRAIAEKSYANDAASIVVSIQWPDGATQPPATITAPPDVELVASCPDSATCSPPAAGARAARPRAARIASGPALLCPLHDELGPVAR